MRLLQLCQVATTVAAAAALSVSIGAVVGIDTRLVAAGLNAPLLATAQLADAPPARQF
jgi:hypothetical protein